MKKLLLILLLFTATIYSQTQYVGVFGDIRNGIVGSDATNNSPKLDILILGGVTDKNGITVEAGYEYFKAIEFQRYYFGLGYTFEPSDKLKLALTIEPGVITRDWKSDLYVGKQSYNNIGCGSRLTYNISDSFDISLLGDVQLRTDNGERYHQSTPKIYSLYLGLIYNFNN